jgi:multicomponent Na+:H+ antiporter subunit G
MSTGAAPLLANVLMIVGALFIFLGALGLVRMPDVFNRIQAATKSVTLGTLALILGVLVRHPDWWPKLGIIVLFVLITSPVGSSTIARAALKSGMRPWARDRDHAQATDGGREGTAKP